MKPSYDVLVGGYMIKVLLKWLSLVMDYNPVEVDLSFTSNIITRDCWLKTTLSHLSTNTILL